MKKDCINIQKSITENYPIHQNLSFLQKHLQNCEECNQFVINFNKAFTELSMRKNINIPNQIIENLDNKQKSNISQKHKIYRYAFAMILLFSISISYLITSFLWNANEKFFHENELFVDVFYGSETNINVNIIEDERNLQIFIYKKGEKNVEK